MPIFLYLMFFHVFFFGKLKINIYVCVIDCINRFRELIGSYKTLHKEH